MTQEKILKIAKGLGSFDLDELLIISELPEKEVVKEIEELIVKKLIVNIDDHIYRFLGYQIQQNTQLTKSSAKRLLKRFSRPNLTFSDASERFLKYHCKLNCKQSTINSYKSFLKNHLLSDFGNFKISEVTPSLIEEFKSNKIKEGLSSRTLTNMLILLRGILELAVTDGAIINNPFNRVKIPPIERLKVKCLSKNEMDKVLKVAKNSYLQFYPLIYTAIFTGLTRSELLGLTWEKIDSENKLIRVDQSLYKREIIPIDTPERIRDVDILENVSQVLYEWKDNCPKGKIGFVFPNNEGKAECADNMIKRKFNPVIREAGVKKISFNDLRNTYAVRLLQNGYPVEYVHKQMGFSSVVVTIDRYREYL